MHARVFLRLEPLGLERVARSLKAEGHEVRVPDLQISERKNFFRNSMRLPCRVRNQKPPPGIRYIHPPGLTGEA